MSYLIVWAVTDEQVGLMWNEDVMENRSDLHWDNLNQEDRDRYRENIRATIVDQNVMDAVREIVWNIASRHLGANTE